MNLKNNVKRKHCSKCNLVIEACRKDYVSIGPLFFCYHHLMFLPAIGITKTDIEALYDIFKRPADLTEVFNFAFKKIITLSKKENSDKARYISNTASAYGIAIDVVKIKRWENEPDFVPDFTKPVAIQISY